MDRSILLVEDEDNDVLLMRVALQKAGIHNPLHVAANGRAAMDYFRRACERPADASSPLPYLIFLDLKLPYVTGLEILKWIRQQPSLLSVIVVILTASKAESDLAAAYKAGANAYLVKPAQLADLHAMTQAVKQFWFNHNQSPQHSISIPGVAAPDRSESLPRLPNVRVLGPLPRRREVPPAAES